MKPYLPVILLVASVLYCSNALAQAGALWGMTASNGTANGKIFKTDSTGGNYTEVYSFNLSILGTDPMGSLVEAKDGMLYGMTSRGGAYGFGVIFQLHPVTGTYIKKHDFDSVNGKAPYGSLCKAANGKLYGMTFKGGPAPFPGIDRGVLFEYDPATNVFTKKIDLIEKNMGSAFGSLIEGSDGKLYGLSSVGGGDATGALFNYDIQLDSLTLLESFIAGPVWEGIQPMGDLVLAGDGKYYGLSRFGGPGFSGGGVLFRYDPNGTMFNKMNALHRFSEDLPASVDGWDLTGSLVQAGNGKLYGMTRRGGTDSAGTIFSFDIATNTFTKVHDLDSTTEGYAPHGSLMLATDSKLYSLLTSEGGQARLFQFEPVTNMLTVKSNLAGTPYYTSLMQLKSTTGVPGIDKAISVKVYPNPVTDKLVIEAPGRSTLQLTSLDGRVVLNCDVDKNATIDVGHIPAGVYLLKLSTVNGVLLTKQLIYRR